MPDINPVKKLQLSVVASNYFLFLHRVKILNLLSKMYQYV
jgi:hypothetical protein